MDKKVVYVVYHDNMFSIGVEGVFTKLGSARSFARRMNKRRDGNTYSVSTNTYFILDNDDKTLVRRGNRMA